MAGPWEITGIEPAQTGYVFSRLQVVETLVTTDKQGTLVLGLAEKWAASLLDRLPSQISGGELQRFALR